MKKFKKLTGLNLAKMDVSRLQKDQLNSLKGGGGNNSTCSCGTSGMCLIDGDTEAENQTVLD